MPVQSNAGTRGDFEQALNQITLIAVYELRMTHAMILKPVRGYILKQLLKINIYKRNTKTLLYSHFDQH